MAVHPVPYGGCVMQDLGNTCRVLRGEGVFSGPGAYGEFLRLAEVFREEGAGLLVHPVWQAERAWFVSLTVEEEPLPDYVRYRFEFWEDWNGSGTALTEVSVVENEDTEMPVSVGKSGDNGTYIVKSGDTMWGIANRCHVGLAELIAANPQIRNPNLIYPGDVIRISL
jgi:spore coat assembly protein SafA